MCDRCSVITMSHFHKEVLFPHNSEPHVDKSILMTSACVIVVPFHLIGLCVSWWFTLGTGSFQAHSGHGRKGCIATRSLGLLQVCLRELYPAFHAFFSHKNRSALIWSPGFGCWSSSSTRDLWSPVRGTFGFLVIAYLDQRLLVSLCFWRKVPHGQLSEVVEWCLSFILANSSNLSSFFYFLLLSFHNLGLGLPWWARCLLLHVAAGE